MKIRPNIVDENYTFSICRPCLKIERKFIGNRKSRIISIRDFYRHPEEVVRLIEESPAILDSGVHAPTARNISQLNLMGIEHYLKLVIRQEYGHSSLKEKSDAPFISNIWQPSWKGPTKEQVAPHIDIHNFTAVIFLNSPADCHGGTAFYAHAESGLEGFPVDQLVNGREKYIVEKMMKENNINSPQEASEYFFKNNHKYSEYISESNADWNLIHVEEMKYNKLIIFEGHLFHAPFINNREWFVDKKYRINQLFYIK